jgi:hypothetical protein
MSEPDGNLRDRIVRLLTERPAVDWRLFPENNLSRQSIQNTLVNRPAVDWQMIPVPPPPPSDNAAAAPLGPQIRLRDAPPGARPQMRFPRPVADDSQGLGFAPGMRRRRQPPPPPPPPPVQEAVSEPMMTILNFDGARQESDMALAARFHGYMPEQKQQMPARQVPRERLLHPLLQRLPNIETQIETYPTRDLEQVDKENTTECSICYEPWQSAQKVRTLPCLHYFHVACIDRWLRQNMSCPQCRHRL